MNRPERCVKREHLCLYRDLHARKEQTVLRVEMRKEMQQEQADI
jgi:hypothetical protein